MLMGIYLAADLAGEKLAGDGKIFVLLHLKVVLAFSWVPDDFCSIERYL